MNDMTNPTGKAPSRVEVVRTKLHSMEGEFKRALPSHIPVERFCRVAQTAILNNPSLLDHNKCSEGSLWSALTKAAQDGLLPDGREGAITTYKGNARWMPMIAGIRKLARNSGDISTWETHCVYEKDDFAFELGDEPFIRHKPNLFVEDRGKIIAAYSIATLKDGSKSREVMGIKDIEGVRSKSRASDGPWNDPVFYGEMVRKTVARRHSKVLPLSTDLDDIVRRDDDMYEFDAPAAAKPERGGKPAPEINSLAAKLQTLANGSAAPKLIEHQPTEISTASKPVDAEEGLPFAEQTAPPLADNLEIPEALRRTPPKHPEKAKVKSQPKKAPEKVPDPAQEPGAFLKYVQGVLSSASDTNILGKLWDDAVYPHIRAVAEADQRAAVEERSAELYRRRETELLPSRDDETV